MTWPLFALYLTQVASAFLWAGAAVGALALVILALGLFRAAASGDGEVATDLEIDQ
jgi:hypothetical protein